MTHISKMLPAMGFVIAAALVALTSAFKDAPKTKSGDTMYTFQYNPPTTDPYSVSHVQTNANWNYTSNSDRCTDDDVQACRIYVSSNDVVPNGSGYSLKSGFSISATESSTDVAYVSSTSDGSGSDFISNKDN